MEQQLMGRELASKLSDSVRWIVFNGLYQSVIRDIRYELHVKYESHVNNPNYTSLNGVVTLTDIAPIRDIVARLLHMKVPIDSNRKGWCLLIQETCTSACQSWRIKT